MSYRLNVDSALIIIELYDDIVVPDLVGIVKDLKEIEAQADVLLNRLIDLSQAVGHRFGFPAVQGFTNERNAVHLKSNVRVAVFAPTDVTYGIARMFQTMMGNPAIELRIFKGFKEARVWALTGEAKPEQD